MRLTDPLDDVFRSPSYVRVLRALHHLPVGLPASAREIARRAGVSHPTASKALASLTEQGLVTRTRAPRAHAFELRRTHTATQQLVTLFEWEGQLRQELISFLRTQIQQHAPGSVTAAFLFGSAAEGDMTSSSDIDVAILVAAGEAHRVTTAMERIAEDVRERFGNHLSVLLEDAPVEKLQKSGRKRHRLWRRILREGMPILDPGANLRHG
jgi:predicted nucleotidyltransferase/predicted transcriptional regulator